MNHEMYNFSSFFSCFIKQEQYDIHLLDFSLMNIAPWIKRGWTIEWNKSCKYKVVVPWTLIILLETFHNKQYILYNFETLRKDDFTLLIG